MSGTPPILDGDGYYIIDNQSNLYWMMVSMPTAAPEPNTSSKYKLTNSFNMSTTDDNTKYNPGTDLLKSICSVTTTGVAGGPFIGIFDGRGNTITIPLGFLNSASYFGLFGFVGNNVVTTVAITDVNLEYNGNTFLYNGGPISNVYQLGSLVGYGQRATINNCNITYNNNVEIINQASLASATISVYTGGIVGRMTGVSVLTNSTIKFLGTGKILSINVPRVAGDYYCGGICGYAVNFSTVAVTLTGCQVQISGDTIIGSNYNNRRVAGICGSIGGGLTLQNNKITTSDPFNTSLSGTLKIQNYDSAIVPIIPLGSVQRVAGLFGEITQYLSSNQYLIDNCSINLSNFDVSVILGSNTLSSGMTSGLIGTIVSVGTNVVCRYSNIYGIMKSLNLVSISDTTSTGLDIFISGIVANSTTLMDVKNCYLQITNNFTILVDTQDWPVTAQFPSVYAGSFFGLVGGGSPSGLGPSGLYTNIVNCSIDVGGDTTFNIFPTQPLNSLRTTNSYIGGLFGDARGSYSVGTGTIKLEITDCRGVFRGNFLMSYLYNYLTPNQLFGDICMGSIIGISRGTKITNNNTKDNNIITIGTSNNTFSISCSTTGSSNSYLGILSGLSTNVTNQSSTLSLGTEITNSNVIINGNVTMSNLANPNSTVPPLSPGIQTWTGGLSGRIQNATVFTNTYYSITGTLDMTATSTLDSASIGGMAGQMLGNTTLLTNSQIVSCNCTVGGVCTINSNINRNYRGLVAGLVAWMNDYSVLQSSSVTYNSSLTMNSTNTAGPASPGTQYGGTRFIGGISGLVQGANTVNRSIIGTSITVQGACSIGLGSNLDNIAGGLFGRLQDGTTVTSCNGTFNQLTISNSFLTAASSGSKIVGGLCANVINSAVSLPATITLSSITVNLTAILSIVTNESGGSSRCGAMFGFIQDINATPGAATLARFCTATFNDTVSVLMNNTGTNDVYLGGIVAENLRSGVISNTLNLANGIIIDNVSTTNRNCFAGIICGRTTSNLLGNPATTNNNTINITGTGLIDTNTNSNTAAAGTLAGVVDSDFKDNTILGQNATFIINATSEQDGTWAGGLIAQITNTQPTELVTVSGNSLFAGHLTLTTNTVSTGSSFNGGLVGRINTTNITFSNNIVSVSGGATLRNIAVNSTVYMALLFAGLGQSGIGGPYTLTNNTFVAYQGIQLTTSNSIPTIYIDDNLAKSDEATPSTLVNCNAYVCGIGESTLLNFTGYPNFTPAARGLTIYGVNFPITSTYTSPRGIYYIEVLPAITINIGCIRYEIPEPQTCCTANICNKNPQVASYSNQTIVNRRAGQAMIADMDNKIIAQNNNTGRIYVQPMFSSYQQYMTYLQSKNAR